tara:strand:+ start:2152 stop:3684 length:1533 start_codon:yes stop_codon:yes gene_type:complete
MFHLDSKELLIIGKGVPGTFGLSNKTFSKEVNNPIGIICRDGEILFVGSVQDAEQLIKKPFQLIDHSNEYILPGFIDSHTHCFASVKHENNLDVSFASGVKNKEELFYKIQEALNNKKIGETLVAVGFDEAMSADNAYPTRKELDGIAQNNPVQIIHRTGHASILNSLALKKCKINETFDEPQGSYLSRNIQSGDLDGYLIGLNEYIDKHLFNQSLKDTEGLMSKWLKSQLSKGITTLVNANYDAELKDWKFFKKILATDQIFPSLVVMESIDSLDNYRFPASQLNGKIIRGHTKIMLNEFDAFIDADYTNFEKIIHNCRKENRKIAIHATTQNSVDFILDFIEKNEDTNIERIEHAPILTKDQIKKIINYNISVVAQPSLLYEANNKYQKTINYESLNNFHPWKRFIELGGQLVFSSDSPVSRLSPLESIAYASIDRPANMNIEQKISVDNAIKAWTFAAAQLNHLPKKGFIQKGFVADLIFLNKNPLMFPANTNVIKTMIAGQVVYSS